MRIGELSRRTELSRDTIRFYERQGLICSQPGSSATNDYRDYPEGTVATLELIGQAQAAGFTIADLGIFLRQIENADRDDFDGEAFLQQKIDDVEANIARSRRFLQTLKAAKKALQTTSFP